MKEKNMLREKSIVASSAGVYVTFNFLLGVVSYFLSNVL